MRLLTAALTLTCSFLLATYSLGGPPQEDKGVLSMTAEEVARAYQQNEAFVDEYLTSKTIQVGGPVVRVFRVTPSAYKEEMQYVVVLESQRRLPVHCFFPGKERKRLAGLRPGELVTIRGTCQGKGDSREPKPESPGPGPAAAGCRRGRDAALRGTEQKGRHQKCTRSPKRPMRACLLKSLRLFPPT